METEKKKWRAPKLVVLVRGNPEEHVLAACKTWGIQGPNAQLLPRCQIFSGSCASQGNS